MELTELMYGNKKNKIVTDCFYGHCSVMVPA